jgi:hypothetical protein
MDRFYVYLFLRKDGTPYYVGKGTGYRQWQKRRRGLPQLPPDRARNVRILDGLSEADAHAWEILLIAHWGCKHNGTGILRNGTDGGEGTSGRVFTQEQRDKISATSAGRVHTPGVRAKIRNGNIAAWTPERRAEKSAWATGRSIAPETRAKLSALNTGRVLTPEHRASLSRAARNRSPETLAKIGAAGKGRTHTAETRAQISASLTGRKRQPRSAETKAKITATANAKAAALLNMPVEQYESMSAWERRKAKAAADNNAPPAEADGALK